MNEKRIELDALTHRIIHWIIRVHQNLGPGFLEVIDRRALVLALEANGLATEIEKEIAIHSEGVEVGRHRLDLAVEGRVIVELKTVEEPGKAHYAQVRSNLKATGLRLAPLINFSHERADFRRIELR